MLAKGWLVAGAAVSIAAAGAGGYFTGKSAGANEVRAEQLQALERQVASRDALQNTIDEHERAAAAHDQARAQEIRHVYREIPRVVAADPVYRNVCLGADGLQLLDQAAAAANGGSQGAPTPIGGSGAVAGSATNDRPGDGQSPR